jgi:TubC N-terminal docking domain
MTLPELVEALEAGGVKLSLRLVVDSPRGVMTDQIKTALAAHKPTLLARLGRDAQWEQLAAQRWGPALNDPTPGIIIDRPLSQDPDRLKAAFEGTDRNDPYALAEREAIQIETLIDPTPD